MNKNELSPKQREEKYLKTFGRLNSRKLKQILADHIPPYEMSKIFPFLVNRSKKMSNRHKIASFKRQMKKYRYCYELYSVCHAQIIKKGQTKYEEERRIDNDVYVFCNIKPNDIHLYDCRLLFDRDAIINLRDNVIILDVIEDMKIRKIEEMKGVMLETIISLNNFLPIRFEELDYVHKDDLGESTFNEFRMRILLYDTDIYQQNNDGFTDRINNKKKTRVEDHHSLLDYVDRYYNSSSFVNNMEKYKNELFLLQKYKDYRLENLSKKLINEIREKESLEDGFLLVEEFLDSKDIHKEKIESYRRIIERYSFLFDVYSKEYKDFFNKYMRTYSKWQTQQIFIKFRSELDMLMDIVEKFEDIENNRFFKQDFGYIGDGLFDDSNEDSIEFEMRQKKEWDIQQEQKVYDKIESQRSESYEEYLLNTDNSKLKEKELKDKEDYLNWLEYQEEIERQYLNDNNDYHKTEDI